MTTRQIKEREDYKIQMQKITAGWLGWAVLGWAGPPVRSMPMPGKEKKKKWGGTRGVCCAATLTCVL